MDIVKVKRTSLRASLSTTGTTIALNDFVDSNGDPLAIADFGNEFVVVVVKQGDTTEIIRCDTITQNIDGTADLEIETDFRDIPPKPPFTAGSTGKQFNTGAEVIVTNDPYTMSFFIQEGGANTFSGVNTYTQFPAKSGALTPTDPEHFVTLSHLNSVLTGGGVVSLLASSVTLGEAGTAGQPFYFNTTDQKWYRSYANNPATCVNVLLGILQEDTAINNVGAMARRGRDNTQTGLTPGAMYYLSDTGTITTTAGTHIIELGVANDVDTLIFEPKDGDHQDFLRSVTGMIVPFAGEAVPSGFLSCDGNLYNFAQYPDLRNVIGAKYGLDAGQTFTVNDATNTVEIVAHGFSAGDQFFLTSDDTLPGGLSADTLYYVVSVTTNNFQLSLTEGGSAVDITSAGTGNHRLHSQFRVPDLRGSVVVGKGQRSAVISVVSVNVGASQGTVTNSDSTSDDEWATMSAPTLNTGDTIVFGTGGPGGSVVDGTNYYAYRSGSTLSFYNSRAAALVGNLAGAGININSTLGGEAFHGGSVTTSPQPYLKTGMKVTLSTDGTLPSGLSAQEYYLIKDSDTQFRFATSYAEAVAGVEQSIANIGVGNHSFTLALADRPLGEWGGEEEHVLIEAEMPLHHHLTNTRSQSGGTESLEGSGDGGDFDDNDTRTADAGGDQAHNNMQPYVVANWIIKS